MKRFLLCFACLLPIACAAQSSSTTEFCNFQQNAFLIPSADMSNQAIALYKLAGAMLCQSLTEEDTINADHAAIAAQAQQIAALQQQLAQLQNNPLLAPVTYGSSTVYGAGLGSSVNLIVGNPFTTDAIHLTVPPCHVYAGPFSDPTVGHVACQIYSQATSQLVCSTAETPIAGASQWTTITSWSNCPQLQPGAAYWVTVDHGPYWGSDGVHNAVTLEENCCDNNPPITGIAFNGGTMPPYPTSVAGFTSAYLISLYLQ